MPESLNKGCEGQTECKDCGTKLFDNTSLHFRKKKEYICPKCIAWPRVMSFVLMWILILAPLPDISWMWIIKVAALIYMARLLQSFLVCVPYFLKIKK